MGSRRRGSPVDRGSGVCAVWELGSRGHIGGCCALTTMSTSWTTVGIAFRDGATFNPMASIFYRSDELSI